MPALSLPPPALSHHPKAQQPHGCTYHPQNLAAKELGAPIWDARGGSECWQCGFGEPPYPSRASVSLGRTMQVHMSFREHLCRLITTHKVLLTHEE